MTHVRGPDAFRACLDRAPVGGLAARAHPRAMEFLLRDLENLDTWFSMLGVQVRGREFGFDVWGRFRMGEIG